MSELKKWEPFSFAGFGDFRKLLQNLFPEKGASLEPWLEEGNLAVDISQGREGETIVRASLPGFKKENIDVQVHDGILTIKAESTEEHEAKGEKFYHKERRWGSLSRRIALPGNPSDEGIAADLKDGVLTVKIPAGKGNQPRRIEIR